MRLTEFQPIHSQRGFTINQDMKQLLNAAMYVANQDYEHQNFIRTQKEQLQINKLNVTFFLFFLGFLTVLKITLCTVDMTCCSTSQLKPPLFPTRVGFWLNNRRILIRMRIRLDYVSWPYENTSQQGIAITSATGSIMKLISSILSVVQQKTLVQVTTCIDISIPQSDVQKTFDYDLLIYATAASGSGYYANAGACQIREGSPNRPNIGRISYNTNQVNNDVISNAGFQVFSRVAFHEMVHVLGFASNLYQYWNPSMTVSLIGGRNFITTTKVKEQVNSYFSCSNLGMLLEDNGGAGSASSHWEKESLLDELMTAQFNSYETLFLSSITLGLLQDTGYYTVNYQNSQVNFMQFGKNEGCSFLTNNMCTARPEYCTGSANAIDFYNTVLGQCSSTIFIQTCRVYVGFTNRICKFQSYLGAYDNLTISGETAAWNSKPYMATVISSEYALPTSPGFRCYKTTCVQSNTQIEVTIGTQTVTCTSNGQQLNVVGDYQGVLTCPGDIGSYCESYMTCNNFCNKTQICINGECISNSTKMMITLLLLYALTMMI